MHHQQPHIIAMARYPKQNGEGNKKNNEKAVLPTDQKKKWMNDKNAHIFIFIYIYIYILCISNVDIVL